ncbi:MAG TPA: hypothetical protein VFV17_01890, partial [Usitatibacteraceae bacterium]|nr:hypothetical protein [Usitatibacteraceae bacterium]
MDSPRYQVPPQGMVDMVDAPAIPQIAVSPDNEWLVLMERPSLPALSELAQPVVGLAGIRINPRNNDQNRAGAATALRLL